MGTTVTFKLNKDATQFQANESVGFGIRGGVKYYDRATKQDAYTNFDAVIFAKQQRQIEFYQSALVAGSIVEVTGQKLAIKQFQGNNGQGNQPQQQGYQQQPQQHQQQNGYAKASGGMQRPQQQPQAPAFDDDIPW